MAQVYLSLTRAEFWHTTPREFRAHWDLYVAREQRADYRAGEIAAAVYNAMGGGKKGGGLFTAADIFPALEDGSARPRQASTDADVVAGWEAWAAMCRTMA